MLEQEIVLGEHNSFERAATDEVHYTMKQYFEILYHLHIVYVTLHRGCPFSQTESVWWLKREAAKSTWWVHSDPNLYDARTQMNWMNWFWNKRFLPPVQASQGMYLLTWDSGLRKLSPEHSHSSKALSKIFFFFFIFLEVPHHPHSEWARGPHSVLPLCETPSRWPALVQLPTVLSAHKCKFKGPGRETQRWKQKQMSQRRGSELGTSPDKMIMQLRKASALCTCLISYTKPIHPVKLNKCTSVVRAEVRHTARRYACRFHKPQQQRHNLIKKTFVRVY